MNITRNYNDDEVNIMTELVFRIHVNGELLYPSDIVSHVICLKLNDTIKVIRKWQIAETKQKYVQLIFHAA